MRFRYHVTLNEIVDLHDRALVRLPRVRRWLRLNALVSGVLAGLIAISYPRAGLPSRILGAPVAFVLGSLLSSGIQRWLRRRRLRRLLVERLGTGGPIEMEIEADENGLGVRQGDRSNRWTWADVESVQERRHELEMGIDGGPLVLVRLDRVGDPSEARAFVDLVRRHTQRRPSQAPSGAIGR